RVPGRRQGAVSRVSVRARFERFPATVKGAFILRGEDPDPHQVVFREARVVGVGGGRGRPVPIASATLDVAPRQDVFVPFELPVSDLDPGWTGFGSVLAAAGFPEPTRGGVPSSFPGRGRRCGGERSAWDGRCGSARTPACASSSSTAPGTASRSAWP